MKKLLIICSAFMLFALGTTTFAQVNVEFNVDMKIPVLQGTFSMDEDDVYVRGNFNDWGETIMEDADADTVYSVTVAVTEAVAYKYFHNHGDGTWEDDPNREFPLPAADSTTTDLFNRRTAEGNPATVTFMVDMQLPIENGNFDPASHTVGIAGNFNGWSTESTELTDDDGDEVYEVTIDTLNGGYTAAFKFIYNDGGVQWEGEYANREFFLADGDNTFFDYWNRVNPSTELGNGNILFAVDMSVMEEAGIFNPITDSVQIRGNFNGWGDSDPDISRMNQDIIDPTLWDIFIPFENTEVGGTQYFKFLVTLDDTSDIWEDGYERPLSQGGGNREVAFMAQETQDGGTYFYDDVHPDWVVPEGTTLEVTFHVDMTDATDPIKQPVPFNPAEDEVYWLPEQPAFARMMGWEDSDEMTILQLIDDDGDMIYSGTLVVDGPAWNAFEYRYIFRDVSEDAFTHEPAPLGISFPYRVRYASMTGPRAFDSPYEMPTDTWLNQDDKSSQSEDQPDGWVNSVRDLDALAKKFELSQNYPNPFNPSTVIKFAIPQTSEVSLKVYNVLGQEVKTLINTEMNAGSYEVKFNASQLASGIYFYSIQAGDFNATKKMMLLK